MVYEVGMLKTNGPARNGFRFNLFNFNILIYKMWTFADICRRLRTSLWEKTEFIMGIQSVSGIGRNRPDGGSAS